MQRLIAFVLSAVLLVSLGISSLTASAAVSEYNGISIDVCYQFATASTYELAYDVPDSGIFYCTYTTLYDYTSPASFGGVASDSVNHIETTFQSGTSNGQPVVYITHLYWFYLDSATSIKLTTYENTWHDFITYGYIPNYKSISLVQSTALTSSADLPLEYAFDMDSKYLINYSNISNTATTPCIRETYNYINTVTLLSGVKRYVGLFDGTTSDTLQLTSAVTPGDFVIYQVSEYAEGEIAPGEEDTGKQQLEVSNSILQNLKNIGAFIGELPTNIYNLFSSALDTITNKVESIGNAIATLPELIGNNIESVLTALFIPPDGYIQHCIDCITDAIYERFPFIDTLFTLWKTVNTRLSSADSTAPVFSVTYNGEKIVFIDFSIFDHYIGEVRAIILAVVWIVFAIHMIKKLPGVIQGAPDVTIIECDTKEGGNKK